MTKQRLLFFIGIWVAVLPFLGFPSSIRKVFFLMTGLGIILLSYFMYIQVKAIKEMDEKGGGIFVKEEDLPEEEPVSASLETSEPISEELSQSDIDDQNEIL
jgi:FtsH-binding integral membrane protein